MFEQDYKNAMERISPDADTRDRVLESIILKEEIVKRKNPALPWRIAFACVACIAIVLGVVFVPRDGFKQAPDDTTPQTLAVSKSYGEIYKLLKKNSNKSPFFFTDEEEVIYEYATGTASKPTSQKNNAATNGTAAGTAAPSDEAADAGTDDTSKGDFSNTTEQVKGVSEADIVKTDGEYIYYVFDKKLSVFKADGQNTKLLSTVELNYSTVGNYSEMFLNGDRLVIVKSGHYKDDKEYSLITVYDISDKTAPQMLAESSQEGSYNSSRMVGDYIYLISNCRININKIDEKQPRTFVPVTETNGVCQTVPAEKIYRYEQDEYDSCYTVIGAFNCKDGALSDSASLLGGSDILYCSTGNIILAKAKYYEGVDDALTDKAYAFSDKTAVSRISISDGKIEYKVSGEIAGNLENQFFIDEYNGYFRFVTTVYTQKKTEQKFENTEETVVTYSNETAAHLTVLDKDLKPVGEIKDLAKGERVYSVRFMGDIAYFVTFRQTDPLFSADLSDPKNPKILGALKIPGFSEYMYPYTDGLLLGFGMDADEKTGRTGGLKLSMFNITDPANVTEDDKTVLNGYNYSPALSDHKAMLVSGDKNLIGFAATDNYDNVKYLIFSYTGDGFERRASLTVNDSYDCYAMTDVRGLFVKDSFYVISQKTLQVFDINTFLQISRIEF